MVIFRTACLCLTWQLIYFFFRKRNLDWEWSKSIQTDSAGVKHKEAYLLLSWKWRISGQSKGYSNDLNFSSLIIEWDSSSVGFSLHPTKLLKMVIKVLLSRAGVKRVLSEMFGGVCGAFLKTLTLTQTKIFDFRYLISELTQKMRYPFPDSKIIIGV